VGCFFSISVDFFIFWISSLFLFFEMNFFHFFKIAYLVLGHTFNPTQLL